MCDDLGMPFAGSFSPAMQDLTTAEGQRQADGFSALFLETVASRRQVPRAFPPPSGSEEASPFKCVLSPDEEELEQKWIAFSFAGVPEGTYVIRCFQDVNGNGKLDSGMFGPKEPWGF